MVASKTLNIKSASTRTLCTSSANLRMYRGRILFYQLACGEDQILRRSQQHPSPNDCSATADALLMIHLTRVQRGPMIIQDMELPEAVQNRPLSSLKSPLKLERYSSQRSVIPSRVVSSSILPKYADTNDNSTTLLRLLHSRYLIRLHGFHAIAWDNKKMPHNVARSLNYPGSLRRGP